jgi:hypothetical protein
LIGIDPANEELVLIWTQTERAQSIADLVNVIQRAGLAAPGNDSAVAPEEIDRSGGTQ